MVLGVAACVCVAEHAVLVLPARWSNLLMFLHCAEVAAAAAAAVDCTARHLLAVHSHQHSQQHQQHQKGSIQVLL